MSFFFTQAHVIISAQGLIVQNSLYKHEAWCREIELMRPTCVPLEGRSVISG